MHLHVYSVKGYWDQILERSHRRERKTRKSSGGGAHNRYIQARRPRPVSSSHAGTMHPCVSRPLSERVSHQSKSATKQGKNEGRAPCSKKMERLV